MWGEILKLINNLFGAIKRHGANTPLRAVNAALEAINEGDPKRFNDAIGGLLDQPVETKKPKS